MTTGDFGAPIDQRYFEDYVAGSVFECGTIVVDHADGNRQPDDAPLLMSLTASNMLRCREAA